MRWLQKAVILWMLKSRRLDAARSKDGAGWILRPTRAHWGLYLFLSLVVVGGGLTALAVSFLTRKPGTAGEARIASGVLVPAGLLGAALALRLKGRRLILGEGGIDDVRSGARIPWTSITGFRLTYDGGFHVMSQKRTIKLDIFMDGLGRLREEMIQRVPGLIVPSGNRWTATHPFEGLPSLRKGSPDVSLERTAEDEATFTIGVDKVYSREPMPWFPRRTCLKGTMLSGKVKLGDWIAPREESGERTWILVIRTLVSAKAEAVEGDKIEMELYGTGQAWIKPGVLSGGSA